MRRNDGLNEAGCLAMQLACLHKRWSVERRRERAARILRLYPPRPSARVGIGTHNTHVFVLGNADH